MKHYHDESCPELASLLRDDSITYSVLIQILQGRCTDIYTDHQGFVICYSYPPYPIWVWCGDLNNEQYIDDIAQCLKSAFPFEKGFSYNISHELMKRLQEKDACFACASVKMGLLSYRLDAICSIGHPCDGYISLPREEELSWLAGVWHDMAHEMEGFDLDTAQCESSVRDHLGKGTLFVWRCDAGQIVALCSRGDQGAYCKIGTVYTLPDHRRRGYAINLVHAVTESILSDGLTPILYTNAGYEASNACYRKIGFREVGRLCNVCK